MASAPTHNLLSTVIHNLFAGVGQQSPELRLPSQSEVQENAISSPIDGLKKRPGTHNLAWMLPTPVNPLVHYIDRDLGEKYAVLVDDGKLKVFDLLTGQEKTVNTPNGLSYLACQDPRRDLRLVSVADYTFLVNTTKTVSMKPSVQPGSGEGTVLSTTTVPLTGTGVGGTGGTGTGGTGTDGSTGTQTTVEKVGSKVVTTTTFTPVVQPPEYGNVYRVSPGFYSNEAGGRSNAPISMTINGITVTTTESFMNTLSYTNDGASLGAYFFSEFETKLGFAFRIQRLSLNTREFEIEGRYGAIPVILGPTTTVTVLAPRPLLNPTDTSPTTVNTVTNPTTGSGTTSGSGTTANQATTVVVNADGSVTTTSYVNGVKIVSTSVTTVYASNYAEPLVVVIKNGVAEQSYRLSINGKSYVYTSGNTDATTTYRIEVIAEAMRVLLTSDGYQVARYGAVLTVLPKAGIEMTFDASDTWNNHGIFAAKGRVATEADLPANLDPHIALAVGDTKDGGYYLRYVYRKSDGVEVLPSEILYTSGAATTISPVAGTKLQGLVYGDGSGTYWNSTVNNPSGWLAKEAGGTGAYEETYRVNTKTQFVASSMPHVLVREANGTFTFKEADWAARKVGDELSVPQPSFVGKKIQDVFFFRNRFGFLTDENIVLSVAGLFFNFWPTTAKEVLDSDPVDLMISSSKVSLLRYAEPFNNSLLVFGDTSQWTVTAQGALTPRTVSVQPSTNYVSAQGVRPVAVGDNVFFVSEKDQWSSVWEYYVNTDSSRNSASEITQHVPRYLPSGTRQLAASASESVLVAVTDGAPNALFVYKYLYVGGEKAQESWSRWTFSGSIVNVAVFNSVMYLAVKYPNGLFLEKMDLQDTTGPWVDRKGYSATVPFEFRYEFSPVFLQGNNGQNTIGAISKLKNMKLFHANLDSLTVSVGHPDRAPVVRKFPDVARAALFRSSGDVGEVRVPIGGLARTVKIVLTDSSPGQVQLQGAEFELTQSIRSQRV